MLPVSLSGTAIDLQAVEPSNKQGEIMQQVMISPFVF